MRKLLLSGMAIGCTIAVQAQVTIDQNDMPVAGTSYGIIQTAGIEIEDPGSSAGANVFWDYSDLNEGVPDNQSYLSVSEVPIQFQFIFNNPFSTSYSNLAIAVDNLTDGLDIPVSDAHNFFRADEEGYYDCGYAASFSSIPIFGDRDPTDRIFKFPLEFGMDADTNDSFFEIDIPQLANYKSYQTRENTTDAWGVVETPSGVYDALRVRSVVNGIDSIYSETFQIDQAIVRPETIEYRWVAPGEGVPVLQINVIDGVVSQVRYKTDDIDTSLPELAEEEAMVYPNPATGVFHAEVPTIDAIRSVDLIDLNGRSVSVQFGQNANRIQVNTGSLRAGLYRVVLSGDEQKWGSWVVIR